MNLGTNVMSPGLPKSHVNFLHCHKNMADAQISQAAATLEQHAAAFEHHALQYRKWLSAVDVRFPCDQPDMKHSVDLSTIITFCLRSILIKVKLKCCGRTNTVFVSRFDSGNHLTSQLGT
jgi:hypothetical protein